MALTKVTGGILSQPIDLGITTATTGFFSGIVTAQSVRVLGDLTVDGSTTTLDTVVTEVDRLEVGANNVTVGVAITQSGTGDILKLYDSSTPVFTVKDGGNVGIGTDNPAYTLDLGESSSTIRLVSANDGTAIRVGTGGNSSDVTLIRVDGASANHDGESDDSANGFSFKYLGSGSGVNNRFSICPDNQAGTQFEGVTVLQDGKVGIGTAIPSALFTVGDNIFKVPAVGTIIANRNMAIQTVYPILQFIDTDSNSDFQIQNANGTFGIRDTTNSANRLVIKSDGNIGIGTDTTTGATGLTVYRNDTSAGNTVLIEQDGTGDAVLGFALKGTASWQFGIDNSDSDKFKVSYDGSGLDSSTSVTLDRTGKVGINSASPQNRLHVIETYVNRTWTPSTSLVSLFERNGISKIGIVAAADSYSQIDFGDTNDDNVGYIRYHHGENSMSFRTNTSERLRIDSDGKVGIGTTNPTQALHIYNSSPVIRLTDIDTSVSAQINATNGNLYFDTTNNNRDVIFRGGSTEVARITGDGKVGINTTIPATQLQIVGSTASTASSGGTLGIRQKGDTNNDGITLTSSHPNSARFYKDSDGALHIHNTGGSSNDFVLANAGNIGIGTAAPDAPLHVFNSTVNNIALFESGDAFATMGLSDSNGSVSFLTTLGSLRIGVNGDAGTIGDNSTLAMTIKNDGNVGIGTDNPQFPLHIASTMSSSPSFIHVGVKGTNTVGGGGGIAFDTSVTESDTTKYIATIAGIRNSLNNGSNDLIFSTTKATVNGNLPIERLRITSTGYVGIGSANPAYTLDFGESSSTIRLVSENDGTAIRVGAGGGNNNVTLLRVDGDVSTHDGESDSSEYGFSLKYMGLRTGNNNSLSLFSDNQTATQIEAITVLQDGRIGINTDNPTARLEIVESKIKTWTPTSQTELIVERNGNCIVSIVGKNDSNCQLAFGDNDDENAGYIDYDHADNSMAFRTNASERLRIDSNGKVGIGTNDPEEALHIQSGSPVIKFSDGSLDSQIRADAANLRFVSGGTTKDFMFQSSVLSTSEVVRITGDGKVGIGTVTPDHNLHVYQEAGDAVITIESTGNNNHSALEFFRTSSGGDSKGAGSIYVTGDTSTSEAIMKFAVGHNVGHSYTPNMVIMGNGEVGIGTDNAKKKLEVFDGDIYLNSTDKKIFLTSDYDQYITANAASNYLVLGAGNKERLRITSTGSVGIGTNNPDVGNTAYPVVQVHGTSTNAYFKLTNSTTGVGSGDGVELSLSGSDAYLTNRESANIIFRTGGSEKMRLDNDGRLGISSTAPEAFLDIEGTGNLAKFGSTDSTYEALYIKNNVSGYPAITNESSPDTIELRSAGSVQATLDYNNNDTNKYFRVTANAQSGDGTELFRVQEDGKVGIGTNSPQTKLHIRQTTDDNTDGFRISRSNSNATYSQYIDTSSRFNIGYSNPSTDDPSAQITLNQDGKTGIGSAIPAQKLDVAGHIKVDSGPVLENSASGDVLRVTSPTGYLEVGSKNSSYAHFGTNRAKYYFDKKIIINEGLIGSYNEDLVLATDIDDERIRIKNDTGNVGIGLTNPQTLLDLHKTAEGEILRLRASNNTRYLKISTFDAEFHGSGYDFNATSTGGALRFSVTSDEKMRITPQGVGIGTNNVGTGVALDVQGFFQVRDANGKLNMQMDGNNGNFKVFQSASGWSNLTYNPNPILAWDYKTEPGDLMYIASGGNTSTADQMALVISDSHGFKVGRSGYDGSDYDVSPTAEYFRITNSGNVGIGTNSPGELIDVYKSSNDAQIKVRTTAAGAYFEADSASSGYYGLKLSSGGTDKWFVGSYGTNNFQIKDGAPAGGDEILTIVDGTSNIAIGTDSAVRGPIHIHEKSNDDVQIHLSNNETGSTSSGRGFTIFGGAGTNGRDMGFVNRETNGAIEFYTNNNGTLTQRGAWVASDTIATFAINTGTTGTHSVLMISNHDTTDYNGVANRSEYPISSDIHFTGSDNPTANRTHAAWRNDVENSITSGSNSSGNRTQIYGVHSTVNSTKYAYILYGCYFFANSTADNANHTQSIIGSYGYAQGYINSSSSVKSANIYGGHFIGYRGGDTIGGHCYGLIGRGQQTTNGTINKTGDITGVLGEVEVDEGQITNGYSFRAIIDVDNNTSDGVSAASTITSAHLYYGSYSVASGTTVTNKRGIWLNGCSENYLNGDLEISGTFEKGTDNFRIPHPLVGLSTTKDLVHSVIEGPQMDLIYRGKTDLVAGISTINIDTKAGMTEGTFVSLCRDIQCFTSNETGWTNVKGSVTGNQLTIIAQDNTCTDTISWMVVGERQDDNAKSATCTDDNGNLIVEPDKKPAKDAVKYECEDNIHNADPNHNPKDD